MNRKKIEELLSYGFEQGMIYADESINNPFFNEKPKEIIRKWIKNNETDLKKIIKGINDCDCTNTEHIVENDAFPYGDNIEYDKCKECGKIINLKCL